MYTFMGVALILVTMCWNKLGRCHIFKILPRNAKGGELKTRGLKADFYCQYRAKTRHVEPYEADMFLVATNDAWWMLRNEARYRN